ncbi:MAG TPA: hypothetical protein PK737_03230 [Bacilli bacterium]|nr:hypothetical protein [Bacilli bacterium]
MREAIGSTWIYMIAIALVILFSGYLALSINYSRAFKVKNEIVNIIERNKGMNSSAQEEIKEYIVRVGYRTTGECEAKATVSGYSSATNSTTDDAMYCVEKVRAHEATQEFPPAYYFKVTVFFQLDIPIISSIFNFDVSGDSKIIYLPDI